MQIRDQDAHFVIDDEFQDEPLIKFKNELRLPIDMSTIKWWAYGQDCGRYQADRTQTLENFIQITLVLRKRFSVPVHIKSGEIERLPRLKNLDIIFLDYF